MYFKMYDIKTNEIRLKSRSWSYFEITWYLVFKDVLNTKQHYHFHEYRNKDFVEFIVE